MKKVYAPLRLDILFTVVVKKDANTTSANVNAQKQIYRNVSVPFAAS